MVSQEEVEAWFEDWVREASATQSVEPGEQGGDAANPLPKQIEADVSASYGVRLTKDEVFQAMDDLAHDSTVENILHRLYVREQIKQGMWSLDHEPTFPQEEVEQSLARWLKD